MTVFSNLDTADNRAEVRKTTGKERVRYSTFWNTDALVEDHLKIVLNGTQLLDVAAESVDQGHWFEIEFPVKYEPQTVTLSHGLLSYSAKFANGYTVRFGANGGAGLMDVQGFAYGERKNISRCAFTKLGYTFEGWSAESGVSEVKYCDTECVEDVTDALDLAPGSLATLWAQWRPNVCHLNFHGNGGGGFMDGQDLSYDHAAALTQNAFGREGYVFCGWARTSDAEIAEFGDGVLVLNIESEDEANVDLYAVWSPLKPDAAETVWAAPVTADNRDVVRKAAAVEQISYGTYWNTDAVDGTVLEVSADGNVIKTTATGLPDEAGTFDCALPLRYGVQTLVHEHGLLRYTARFANGYTVRFDANGGSGLMEPQEFAYGERKNVAANQFLKLGYTFAGWSDAPNASEIKFENAESVEDVTDALALEPGSLVTLYAQWRANTYTVRFDANGGVGFADNQSLRYDSETKLSENVFTRLDCVFTGWSEDPAALIPTYGNGAQVKNLTADDNCEIVLYAVWSRLRPDSVETSWADEGTSDNRTFVRKAAPTELISYGTYWNTDAPEGTELTVTLDGEAIKTTATGSDDIAGVFEFALPQKYGVQTMRHEHGLLSYSALFANGYTVRFDQNGGNGQMGVQEFAYGERKNIVANQFAKEGYTFDGWSASPGVSEVLVRNAESVEDITDALNLEPGSLVTLYAQWRPNNFTVKFYANGGVGFDDEQQMRYDEESALKDVGYSRVNCVFVGWSEDPNALLPTYTSCERVRNLSADDGGLIELYAVWSRLRPDPTGTSWAEEMTADNRDVVRKASEVERISYGTGWNTDAASGSVLTVALDGEMVKTVLEGDGVFDCAMPLRYGVQTMTHDYGLLSYSARFANGYSVRFEANGGIGDMEIQGFAYGERKNISSNAFSKHGYTFAGWSAAPNSAEIKYYDSESVLDITDALELKPGSMVVLYAQWRPNIYTILFGANGGSGWMDSIRAAFDEIVGLVANLFTKAGQIFAGWSTDSGASISMFADRGEVLNLTDQDGGEVELYAVWSQAKPDAVTTVWSDPVTADNRDVVRKAAAVEQISYGTYWNTDASDGTVLEVSVDGSVVKTTATGLPDEAGTFDCALPLRYEVQTLVHEHGLLRYTARFANGYTVRFDANGGTGLMEPQEFAYGERKNIAANRFVKNGYSFAGWSVMSGIGTVLYQNSEFVEDITDAVELEPGSMVMLYAQWRPNSCRLEFHGNGGAGYIEGQTVTYDAETRIESNTFKREGFVFCGWARIADVDVAEYGNGASVLNVTNENNAVVDLYAIWSPEKPNDADTVWADERIADNRDGVRKTSVSELISYGTYWNADAPNGTELRVALDGSVVKSTSTGAADVAGVFECEIPLVYGVQTLTLDHGLLSYSAQFANGYLVGFDANGGRGEMEQQGFAYGERKNICANQFTKTGYQIAGWSALPKLDVVKVQDGECVEDLTDALGLEPGARVLLTAVWKPNTYQIRFNANGGTGEMENQALRYDSADNLAKNHFIREGYVFAGWATNPWAVTGTYSDLGEVKNLTAVDGAVLDLYAVWSIQSPDPSQTAWTDIIAMLLNENFKDISFADEAGAILLTDAGVKINGISLGDDNESVFSFKTEGNGQVSFEWRVSSESGADVGWWAMDGIKQESASGKAMNWTKVSKLITDGSCHVWSFGYAKDESDAGGEDCAMFRGFKWTPESEMETGDDASSAVSVVNGVIVIDGAVLGDAASASYSTNTVGNGTLVFRWTVSSEKDCDVGTYSKDGVVIKSMSGKNNPWIWETNTVSDAGSHVWTFAYTKDSANKAGGDSMSVADLQWIPMTVFATVEDVGKTFGKDSDVSRNITDASQLAAFNNFLMKCGVPSVSAITDSQKQWAYQSFKLSEIMTAPQLFEEEPVLKIDDIELSGGNLALTVSLHASVEAITLAKDKLAEKIRVGTSLDAIVETPQILASPSADGTSLTFTVAPPEGDKGFVRILIE